MKNPKGSAAVWAIVILVIVIVAGAAYWYWSQNSIQSTTSATTEVPAQQNTAAGTQTTPVSNPTTQSAPAQSNSAPSATVDQSSLTQAVAPTVTITGAVSNASSIQLFVTNSSGVVVDAPSSGSSNFTITSGHWSLIISNDGTVGPALYQGVYTVVVKDHTTGAVLATGTLTISNGSTQSVATLIASPTSGRSPLTVTFSGGGSGSQAWGIDYGDGSSFNCSDSSCTQPVDEIHTYSSPGIYTATLGADGGYILGRTNIMVTGNSNKPFAAIDWSSLKSAPSSTNTDTATITGEGINVPYVRVYLEDVNGHTAYDSDTVPVLNYHWSVIASAPRNDYTLHVYGYSNAAGTFESALGELAGAAFYTF